MHIFVIYSTTSTETLPSRLHSTTSTYLANTQLELLKHYYTCYTIRITDLACTQLEFEQKDEISISNDESKYEVPQHENAMLTPRKKCMDHQAPYQFKEWSGDTIQHQI
jgi:hypothetical protein